MDVVARLAAGIRHRNPAATLAMEAAARLAFRPIKNLELRMNVINISDESYYEQVYQGHPVPGASRTFLFSANVAF